MERTITINLSEEEQKILKFSGFEETEFIHKAIMNMSPQVANKRNIAVLNIVTAVNELQFCVKQAHMPIIRRIKKEVERLCSL